MTFIIQVLEKLRISPHTGVIRIKVVNAPITPSNLKLQIDSPEEAQIKYPLKPRALKSAISQSIDTMYTLHVRDLLMRCISGPRRGNGGALNPPLGCQKSPKAPLFSPLPHFNEIGKAPSCQNPLLKRRSKIAWEIQEHSDGC